MKNFILFVLCFVFIFYSNDIAIADTSNIYKLVFITEPQTVAPNTVSKYLTLQIQDVSSNQVTAPETIRFDTFQTTSATGVFVSCTTPTNPPTDYMSKNSSNKNICYKDSTEGTYTLTAKTNNTVNPLVATQQIIISAGSIPPIVSTTTSTTTGSTSTTTGAVTTTTMATDNSYYVYSGSVSLSTHEPLSLSVEAGRERLGYLHVPLEFKSYATDKKSGSSVSGARYYWTFGDGTSGEGSIVTHSYLIPGEYNVVLNSSSGEEDAVDITKVKIVSPKIKMTVNDSYIEFINDNNFDLNIGNWKARGDHKEYLIPRDTIISVGGNIKIPKSVLSHIYDGEKMYLIYPDNQVAFEAVSIFGEDKQKQITQISEKLLAIKNELYNTYGNDYTDTKLASGGSDKSIAVEDTNGGEGDGGEKTLAANTISSPVSKNIISRIIDFFGIMFK